MNAIICDKCNQTESKIISKKEKIAVRGEEIEVTSNVRTCLCGNELFDEKLEEANLINAYDEYRKRHNILAPSEIKEIREKYGLPQRTLCKILGWGEITIHRYETGAIPDVTHNKMLRLLKNPEVMKAMLIEVQGLIPNTTFKRTMERIGELLETKRSNDFLNEYQRRNEYSNIDIKSGYRQFNLQKTINSILFFAKNVPYLWQTKLNKLLFYSDFKHFKYYTLSLTGLKYLKYEYGPVPKNYDALLSIMETEGLINLMPAQFGDYPGILVQSLADYDPDLFTKEELLVLEEVKNKFSEYTSRDISNISHKEKGWMETPQFEIISYSHAFELNY